MDQAKCFKGCLPQNLLGPFLNTLANIILATQKNCINHHMNFWRHNEKKCPVSVPFIVLDCSKKVRVVKSPSIFDSYQLLSQKNRCNFFHNDFHFSWDRNLPHTLQVKMFLKIILRAMYALARSYSSSLVVSILSNTQEIGNPNSRWFILIMVVL